MELNPKSLSAREMYLWMVHGIIPRPIAWISTVDAQGRTNLAPFSFFQGVCARPPILMFCPANDRFGNPKDTLRNVRETEEFVVHLAATHQIEALNSTAASLPHGESEIDRLGWATVPSVRVKPPRLADCALAWECRLERIVAFSEGPIGGHAVFGRIVHIYVRDNVLGESGYPEATLLDPAARLGGEAYVQLGRQFYFKRPD